MHGPPLATCEIIVLLNQQIGQLIACGVGHDRAVAEVADRHGVDRTSVARLVAPTPSLDNALSTRLLV
jgi:hypothetical protein